MGPVVSFSLSKDFNDLLAADLKSISVESAVKSKKREEVVDAFIKHSVTTFRAPEKILSDNGGEYSNDLFHVLGEQFNINVKTTPGKPGQMVLLSNIMQFWEEWSIN